MKYIKTLDSGVFKSNLSLRVQEEINKLEKKGYVFIDLKLVVYANNLTRAWIIYSD
ncbi:MULTISPECIES: hypothetical protein [Lactobacillales]|uniref:hypothetical protein n=1 Tax=Lactobacillales TaxID=186826 RepID=UPI001BCEA714|nr:MULTISPECIES: hypothetical protein [Lactococcus]MBS4464905.1 hypothetical protein [Lactococcus garvieae]